MSIFWNTSLIFLMISPSGCTDEPTSACPTHIQDPSVTENTEQTSARQRDIAQISRTTTFNSEASTSSSDFDELDNSSEGSPELEEPPLENLHPDTSIEPAHPLEKEYLDYFDSEAFSTERKTIWESMVTLHMNGKREEIIEACKTAYKYWLSSSISNPIVTAVPLNIPSYKLCIATLVVGVKRDKTLWIDVLQFEEVENSMNVYVTKGRRNNSVYFLKFVTENHFVLDDKFESDVDLEYDFASVAKLLTTVEPVI